MILDYENIFSKEQKVTATGLSDKVVDLGAGDTGPSEGISLFATLAEPFTRGGFTIELKTSDEVTSAGKLSNPVTVATYPCAEATAKAGGKVVGARLPHGMRRYATLNYVLGEGASGGVITAGLTWDVQAEATEAIV